MRKLVLSVFAVLLLAPVALAQEQQVTGTVTSSSGEPLPGVSVLVKGTSRGVVTDAYGQYAIAASPVSILQFSFVGMTTVEETVGPRTMINVVLESDLYQMDRVVVTSTGMTRLEKTLGYASATVDADEIAKGRSPILMDGLIGKVAGMNISNAGGTGSSSKVIIRGYSSLVTNQPLYIVDGVPIDNSYSGLGGRDALNNSIDFGNRANDINPDDVESITVLKGASATALYGSRAANGVIMITTKRADYNQDVQIVYSGSFMGNDVLRIPQTQKLFGQGWEFPFYYDYGMISPTTGKAGVIGSWAPDENGSWGPRLDGRWHEWAIGAGEMGEGEYLYKKFKYADKSLRKFYDIGFETTNNVSISGGNQNSSFMFSYGNTYSNGVLPGNKDTYKRNNISVRGNSIIKKGLATLDYSISYVRSDIRNAMDGQGNLGATIYQNILQYPVDINYKDLKDYNSVYNNMDNYYTPYAKNPFWVVDHNYATYQDDRVYGKVELQVPIIPGFKVIGRLGGDFNNSRESRGNDIWAASPGSWNQMMHSTDEIGSYLEAVTSWNQLDGSVLLNADYRFGREDKFSINATAGWNLNQTTRYRFVNNITGLIKPGYFDLRNSNSSAENSSLTSRKRLIGLLAQADIGYGDFLYLSLNARNDWSSSLPIDDNSFFYWGAGLSWILTQMAPQMRSEALTFMKFRMSYGQTGNDADVYLTYPYYTRPTINLGFGNITYPLNGVTGFSRWNLMPSTDLKPEISSEFEIGIDMRLLRNRIILDASFYNKNTRNQIVEMDSAPETGYSLMTANIGKVRNRGVELMATFRPVQAGDFSWDLTYTFAKNWSKVLKLWDDVEEYSIYSLSSGVSFVAMVGQPLGVFTYAAFRTVEEGEHKGKVIVNSWGFPEQHPTEKDVLGTSAPKFTMGFNNTFRWKDLALSFMLDWRKGGMMTSATKDIMYFNGNAPGTAYNERNGFVYPNSVRSDGAGGYIENNIPVNLAQGGAFAYYYSGYNSLMNRESNFVSKSYLKLREVNITYSLPQRLFKRGHVKGMDISLIGRNLLMWTSSNGFIDPDVSNYGNDIFSEWGEYYAAPSVRTFGGSIRLVF